MSVTIVAERAGEQPCVPEAIIVKHKSSRGRANKVTLANVVESTVR